MHCFKKNQLIVIVLESPAGKAMHFCQYILAYDHVNPKLAISKFLIKNNGSFYPRKLKLCQNTSIS